MTDRKAESLSLTYKNFGLKGLLTKIDLLSKEKLLPRFLVNLDKKYFVLMTFLKDLVKMEENVSKYGLKKQAEKLVKKLKIDTAVYSDISNANFQNQKGLIIYGVNHNAFIEPVILFSLLKQKKIKLILYRMYFFWGKNIRRFSLPVAARNYHTDKINGIKKLYDFSYGFRKSESLSDSQIIMMNDKSLKSAAKLLESGGTVVIFPGGYGSELNKWRLGISRIILTIDKKRRKDVSLLPVYFSGMGLKRMLIRIYKAYKNIRQNKLRVGVYFGKERSISEVYGLLGNKISEKSILEYLRKDAFSQYGLKEFPLKVYLYPRNYPLALSRSLTFMMKLFIQIIPFRDFFRS